MPCPGLPFNGRHPRDPRITWIACKYMGHYSFTDPKGWKAELLVEHHKFVIIDYCHGIRRRQLMVE